ncbi:MAG: hypothetical protein M1826_001904 [Phylliscum demangeonii]|nr:MAG: hypothetical protein M1826_001904 [Phylliscum demangeonii]
MANDGAVGVGDSALDAPRIEISTAATMTAAEGTLGGGLDSHGDARAIVRLVQCPSCAYPIHQPMTLPCGYSLCRTCLPPLHRREHISYPDTPQRLQGFRCPFAPCAREHSLADCSQDVTLAKVLDLVHDVIARFRPVTTDTPLLLEEVVHPASAGAVAPPRGPGHEREPERAPRARVLHGGRIVATYTLAEMGELAPDADLTYRPVTDGAGETASEYRELDRAVLEHIQEAIVPELECQVCYSLLLEPQTTPCGHTFCRRCLHRVHDHSPLCPICRRPLPMLAALDGHGGNKRLTEVLIALCAASLAARAAGVASEEAGAAGGRETALFVCTLSFPGTPTFLHIFEPRYRLMVRRAIESGDRKFGMVMYNRTGDGQGALGATPFVEYGTLLHVLHMELLPDGRSLIETIGVARFRVKDWRLRDGYMVAHIDRVEDLSLAEEEALEARETAAAPAILVSSPASSLDPLLAPLDRLSTAALLQIGLGFVTKMRAASAPWLHERVLAAYGHPPDDPALFPFWFASLLPISEAEKYQLLPIRSVRERLKVTARWIGRIEAQRW